MNDETKVPAAPAVNSMDAQIDALVAKLARPGATRIEGDKGAMQVTISRDENGNLNSQHTVLRAPTPSSGTRLPDSGVDTQAEAERLHRQLSEMDERLKAVAGFDRVTGKPLFVLPEGSRERQNLALHRDQFARSVTHQLGVFRQLDAQREADRNSVTGPEAERRLTEAFTLGNPARAQALREELERLEAADAAALIYAARRGSRK